MPAGAQALAPSPPGDGQTPAPALPADSGQTPVTASPDTEVATLSPECRVPGRKLHVLAPMPAVRAALRDDRALRVLVIGASMGGSSFSATTSYPERLRGELERDFKGTEIEVVHRALTGEVGAGAADFVRNATAEVGPDLVVWQVGTYDALARVALGDINEALDETLAWLKTHEIDALVVNPQYAAALGGDEHYASVVRAVDEAAGRNKVALVLRHQALKHLAFKGRQAPSGFALNALGKRCLAEHVSRTIAAAAALPAEPLATNAMTR